jgi:membrane-bound metal-dependent hydrolase YbcI (DUF457 family)
MNIITHLLSAYLLGRAIKLKHGEFYTFFLAIAGIIPDVDLVIGLVVPNFPHGVFSHTILGGMAFEMIYVLITVAILYPLIKNLNISIKKLVLLAMLGLCVHLFLDIFTYAQPGIDDTHHLYFWPFSDYSVHMNIIWTSVTYTLRVWVEVIYTTIVACIVLFYGWCIKKEDPFLILIPKKDFDKMPEAERNRIKKRFYIFVGILIVMVVFLLFA